MNHSTQTLRHLDHRIMQSRILTIMGIIHFRNEENQEMILNWMFQRHIAKSRMSQPTQIFRHPEYQGIVRDEILMTMIRIFHLQDAENEQTILILIFLHPVKTIVMLDIKNGDEARVPNLVVIKEVVGILMNHHLMKETMEEEGIMEKIMTKVLVDCIDIIKVSIDS